jgi:hypothetical protein
MSEYAVPDTITGLLCPVVRTHNPVDSLKMTPLVMTSGLAERDAAEVIAGCAGAADAAVAPRVVSPATDAVVTTVTATLRILRFSILASR